MKRFIFFALFAMMISCNSVYSNYLPVIKNEHGDTVLYTYPPPETTFVKNHIVVRFKPNALNLDLLCIGNNNSFENKNHDKNLSYADISYIMHHKFYIDDLLVDTNFRNAIKSFGGDSLCRLTWASPCRDTISVSRNGDTIICDDYLWMLLYFNNDTSVISASTFLTMFYQAQIEEAEPDYFVILTKGPPNDGFYILNQISLHVGDGIGVEPAWDYTVGNHDIKIGVVDNGIYWSHCDFGGNLGPNYKVTDGYNFDQNNSEFNGGDHGTPVAGIIGALTNRTCSSGSNSVAGIAAGWYDDNTNNLGCQLIALKFLMQNDTTAWLSHAVAAIRVGSSSLYDPNYPNNSYGFGCHVLNISWIVTQLVLNNQVKYGIYSEYLRRAINYAFENNVSVVCSRGNYPSDDSPEYPACLDPSWVLNVGGSYKVKTRSVNSSFGKYMDVLAPYGGFLPLNPDLYSRVYTTKEDGSWDDFRGTSAAAPHVVGVVGLLNSYALDNPAWHTGINLEPEDYEGMIKASALDIDASRGGNYLDFYDNESGWGHLQADNLFNKIGQGYQISHFSTTNITFGDWKPNITDKVDWAFTNSSNIQNKILSSGNYKIRYRECTGTINLPGNTWSYNNNENKLYVWGRSNGNGLGGFSNASPNYQTRYTSVTSGTGGNGLTDGIIHSQSLNVEAKTYQYDVLDANGTYRGHFPPDNQLALNISVFGIKTVTSVKLTESSFSNNILECYPVPAAESLTVVFVVPEPGNVSITIFDVLGNKVYSSENEFLIEGKYKSLINISNFSNGIFNCRVSLNGKFLTNSFMVRK